MPNIRDVARACGVAPITVSAVLNNKNDKVSAETRERVLRVMREMEYRPGPAVRTLLPKRRNILGVITWQNDLWNDFYHARILAGAGNIAQERHQHLLLFARYLWFEETQRSIRTYGDDHCDGMIIFPYRHDEPIKSALWERGLPFVAVGDTCDEEGYASVDIDNVKGANEAMEHLIRLGHRRIAFMGGLKTMRFSVLREQGYAAALAHHHIPFDPVLVSEGELDVKEGYDRTQLLLRLPPAQRPTALFCGTDDLAFGALYALNEQHIRVPEQMSVVGFDDRIDAPPALLPLTTLRQPYQQIGARAVEILLDRIAGKAPERVILPGELIVRTSTAPPPPNQ